MRRLVCLFVGIAVAAGMSAAAAQNDWMDYVDDPTPGDNAQPVEDNPEWDKYDFELPLVGSEDTMSFKQIARKGQPFVIYWWLTGCPMCNLQMPFVQQLYKTTQDDELGLGVYSICIDSQGEEYKDYISKHKIAFPVMLDQHARRTRETYKVNELGTPLAYVFNKEGLLVDSIEGYRSNFSSSVLSMLGIDIPVEDD